MIFTELRPVDPALLRGLGGAGGGGIFCDINVGTGGAAGFSDWILCNISAIPVPDGPFISRRGPGVFETTVRVGCFSCTRAGTGIGAGRGGPCVFTPAVIKLMSPERGLAAAG
jgi:hypothetical protein